LVLMHCFHSTGCYEQPFLRKEWSIRVLGVILVCSAGGVFIVSPILQPEDALPRQPLPIMVDLSPCHFVTYLLCVLP
jgi:hypothetical protein